jgi:hypothetical protein
MLRMKRFLLLPFISILSVSCASIDTTGTCLKTSCTSSVVSVPLDKSGGITNGIIYSLPRQNIEIEIKNELMSKTKLLKKQAELSASLKKKKEELESLEKQKKSDEEFVKAIADQSATLKQKYVDSVIEVKVNIGKLKQTIKSKEADIAKVKADIAKLPVDDAKQYKLTASAKALAPYPDSEASLSAIVKEGGFTSESIEIKTTDAGLLSGGTGTSKGNIDEIFIALAGVAGTLRADTSLPFQKSLSAFSLLNVIPPADPNNNDKCNQAEFDKKFIVNPNTGDAAKSINDFFKTNQFCLKFNLDNHELFKKAYKSTEIATSNINKKAKIVEYFDGLVYPRQSKLNISICETDAINSDNSVLNCSESLSQGQSQTLSVNIINPGQLGVVKLKQGYFADNSYEYDFANGMLTRYKSDQQNEFVSFLAMFPEMAKAIVSIPAEIIQLKFNLSDKEKAYYEAQTAIYKAKLEHDYYLKNPDAYTSSLNSGGDADATDSP